MHLRVCEKDLVESREDANARKDCYPYLRYTVLKKRKRLQAHAITASMINCLMIILMASMNSWSGTALRAHEDSEVRILRLMRSPDFAFQTPSFGMPSFLSFLRRKHHFQVHQPRKHPIFYRISAISASKHVEL